MYFASRAKARELRNNPTPAEALLWKSLRKERLGGFRFLRQRPFGPYIADFYCHKLNLVIEIDNDTSPSPKDKDRQTDLWYANNGKHVLRFRSEQVLRNLANVLDTILLYTTHQTRSKPHNDDDFLIYEPR